MSDEQIIDLFKHGKREKAFKKLYGQWSKILNMVSQYGGDKDDAKDIFQESLIILYNKLESDDFKLTGSLNGYIYQTSRHLCLKQLQKQSARSIVSLGNEADDIQVEDESHLQEQSQLAEKALEKLAEKCRDILRYFYLERKSMEWIAEQLGLKSEQAAKTQKYKCLEVARNEYQHLLGKEDLL